MASKQTKTTTAKKAPVKKQSPVKAAPTKKTTVKAAIKKDALTPVTVKQMDPETFGVYIGEKLQANLFGSKNTCNGWAEAIRGNMQAQVSLYKSVYNKTEAEAIAETNKKYS